MKRRPEQLELFEGPPKQGPLGSVEAWAASTNRRLLMGVDEAGRGPLAGPVVAAAVVLPDGPLPSALEGINDSKKLSARARQRLAPLIISNARAVAAGMIDAARIDEINILEATRQAMRLAIDRAQRRLRRRDFVLLIDGHQRLPRWGGEQWAVVKGDGRSHHIAAASIIAKITRDHLMSVLGRRYPGYGFERNMGYGTVEHRRALTDLGPSPIHRQTFQWTPVWQ